MKQMKASRKVKNYLELAKRIALQSDYGNIKHGAVLTKGGSIINVSCNKNNYCSFGKRFRDDDKGKATLHAELGCVLNLDRSVTQGTDIYVIRINRRGDFRLSKPCQMCEAALRYVGVKRAFYTTNDGTVECHKL